MERYTGNSPQVIYKLKDLYWEDLLYFFGEGQIGFPNPSDEVQIISSKEQYDRWKEKTLRRYPGIEISVLPQGKGTYDKIEIKDKDFIKDKEGYIQNKGAYLDNIRRRTNFGLDENIDPKAQKKHKGKSAPFGSAYQLAILESLRDWFKKEDWVRINTSGNITGPCGTMKKGKPTTRCLPRKKAQSLTKAQRKATVAKKVRGSKKGKQFVKNTEKAKFKKK